MWCFHFPGSAGFAFLAVKLYYIFYFVEVKYSKKIDCLPNHPKIIKLCKLG